jgi:hypothetical protein
MKRALLVLIAGCYQPEAAAPCSITCSTTAECPGELQCTGGLCAAAGAACNQCFGQGGLVQVCIPAPAGSVTPAAEIDTDLQMGCGLVQPTGTTSNEDQVCYVAGTEIDIATGTTVRAHGMHPLVMIATDAITIDGTIDVSSSVNGTDLGAGGNDRDCGDATPPAPAIGGAGGSFGISGGSGGGDGGGNPGGIPNPIATATRLRGGCAGQDGGAGGATAGDGGGAVYLIATRLSGAGTINASGAGGHSGLQNAIAGGGGGGAGGLVGIEVAVVDYTGMVMANGGGGSSGASLAAVSMAGGDPSMPGRNARGGLIGASGDGGDGAIFLGPAGAGTDGSANVNLAGGGGGGGGTGLFRVFPASLGNAFQGLMVSPVPI